MAENLLILGKNSYVGNKFTELALARRELLYNGDSKAPTILSLSSKECNLLDGPGVKGYFSSLPKIPFTVVFFAVVNKSAANSYQSFIDNIQIIRNFLTAAPSAMIDSVVYISTVDVYGTNAPLPITEETPVSPDTWYGLAKYNCEWMLRESKELSCPVTVLRIPGIFGKAPNDRSVIGKFITSIKETGSLTLTGGGKALRDYVSVKDISELILELIPLRYHGVLNGVTGTAYSMSEIVDFICKELALSPKITLSAHDERTFNLSFNNKKLTMLLSNFTFYPIQDGIRTYSA